MTTPPNRRAQRVMARVLGWTGANCMLDLLGLEQRDVAGLRQLGCVLEQVGDADRQRAERQRRQSGSAGPAVLGS